MDGCCCFFSAVAVVVVTVVMVLLYMVGISRPNDTYTVVTGTPDSACKSAAAVVGRENIPVAP